MAEEEEDDEEGDEDSLEIEQLEDEAVEEAVVVEKVMGDDEVDLSVIDPEASFAAIEEDREKEDETRNGRKRGKPCYNSRRTW